MKGPADLLPRGRMHGVIQMAFIRKNTNIEAENNFAGAQKAQMSTAGRSALSISMPAKRSLADAKRLHFMDVDVRLWELHGKKNTVSITCKLDSFRSNLCM